jgi:molybdenum cofactor cytidylyltransferase
MRFGEVAVEEAVGAILVHTLHAGGRVLKKGHVLGVDDVAALSGAGQRVVACARLDDGDLGEDAAAAAVAAAMAGPGLRIDPAHTGRANVHAAAAGLLVVDAAKVARVNGVDEAITLATLPAYAPVRDGDMVATVKIIPFAAPAVGVATASAAARGAIALAPWRPRRAGLVLTRLSDTADKVLDRIAEAQRARLGRCGGALVREVRIEHETGAVAGALAALAAEGLDPILALGASAIADRRDVLPAALERAGGRILRFGMPVDPGNLLLLGELGAATFVGMPGCARSERRSGFDWVLERLCADVPVAADEIAGLGVGGLLEEIAARPMPRG